MVPDNVYDPPGWVKGLVDREVDWAVQGVDVDGLTALVAGPAPRPSAAAAASAWLDVLRRVAVAAAAAPAAADEGLG